MSADATTARGPIVNGLDHSYFRKKNLMTIAIIALFIVAYVVSAAISDFNTMYAFTSIPAAVSWTLTNFMPTAAVLSELPLILEETFSTVLASVAATVISAILGLFLAVLGSESIGVSFRPVRMVIRIIASFYRNVPIVAWALLLLLSFKQGEFTGFLALFLTTFGMLTRFFLDTFDEVALGPVEALKATGASYWQIVFQGALPMAVGQLMSWTLYMVETNIRSATLVGMLTGSGIGFVFDLFYKRFNYEAAGLVVLVTIVAVIAIELLSNRVRRSMIR